MEPKKHRERIPQADVLAWLQASHPALLPSAELDRDWVWLTANLKGDEHKATRESLKQYGFIFSRRGGHKLPSGNIGTWGHSCNKPLPFKRKGQRREAPVDAQPTETVTDDDDAALAFAMGG